MNAGVRLCYTNSRASFKTEAPLETIICAVATPGGTPVEQRAVTGSITVDLAKTQDVRGTIKVDLAAGFPRHRPG